MCCRQFRKLFSGCTREAARAVRAREGVASTRRKHLAPSTRQSRVELEAKWHSKWKKIESVSTLLSFRRAKLTTRKIGFEGLRFVARPPFLSFRALRSFVPPLFASNCSRCLINVPKSKLDSTRYSTTILFANTWPSARAFNQFVGQSEMIYKF